MKVLFNYLIFPGFLFSACVGLIAGWVDRSVTARIQWRKGPPWYQNFVDIVKLLGKETIVPAGAKPVFLFCPFLGFLSAVIAAAILGKVILLPLETFIGDTIVIIYLLTIPAISMIMGALSFRNPLSSAGASREMKLILAYELPFILSLAAVIVKCGGTIELGSILNHQINFGSNIISWSGALAFIVAVFCMQAKLGFVPFDASEAEQEIMGGALIEYSGVPLAVFKLTKGVLLYAIPLLLINLFLGGGLSAPLLIAKYVTLLIIIILIKNTNPRLRIGQAVRFFLGPITIAAIFAVILAILGY